jgi:hypothetical protein
VEFIVVGGVAAVLHGALTTTQDLDIVHHRAAENIKRLLAVLQQLDAKHRDPSGRVLPPTEAELAGTGQLNLSTRLGPVEPRCQLHDGRGYDDLFEHSELMTDDALTVRVLDLDTLIQIKAGTGRAKDRLMVPILLALRDEEHEESDDAPGHSSE